jgi:hypothetical protein
MPLGIRAQNHRRQGNAPILRGRALPAGAPSLARELLKPAGTFEGQRSCRCPSRNREQWRGRRGRDAPTKPRNGHGEEHDQNSTPQDCPWITPIHGSCPSDGCCWPEALPGEEPTPRQRWGSRDARLSARQNWRAWKAWSRGCKGPGWRPWGQGEKRRGWGCRWKRREQRFRQRRRWR